MTEHWADPDEYDAMVKEQREMQQEIESLHYERDHLAQDAREWRDLSESFQDRAEAAEAALRDLLGFVESGDLVRNAARDDAPMWALGAMKLVMALKRAQAITEGNAPKAPPEKSP